MEWLRVVAPILALLPAPALAQVDHADPVAVLGAMIAAFQAGDASGLPGLCDPLGENDADTRDLCAIAPGSPEWDEIAPAMGAARVTGPAAAAPDVEGAAYARVPFAFTYRGDAIEETMELVRRDGGWYLSSF